MAAPALSETSLSVLDQRTLVLNRWWVPVHLTTVRRALAMMYRRAAAAVRVDTYETFDFRSWTQRGGGSDHRVIRTVRLLVPVPDVIILLNYDRVPSLLVPFSRRNLSRRDRSCCQYCGRREAHEIFTIDHIVPRSLGGKTDWSNCVLACGPCNRRKGGRTPVEAGMKLLSTPRRPDWSVVSRHEGARVPEAALRWLSSRRAVAVG